MQLTTLSGRENKKYFLWNQPPAGFHHQVALYTQGFALAILLKRAVILNNMCISGYHNRKRDNEIVKNSYCDPKIFFNWEKLNKIVEVKTVQDCLQYKSLFKPQREKMSLFSWLRKVFSIKSTIEVVSSVDLTKKYQADFLCVKYVDLSKDFYPNGIVPKEIMYPVISLVREHLDYSDDIKERAKRIINRLGDYDAIHVRRGDWIMLKHWTKEQLDKFDLYNNIEKLKKWIKPGRKVYIATDERDPSYFGRLRGYYDIYFKEDFMDVLSDERLPKAARNNNYYFLCIEEVILSKANHFVSSAVTSATRKVDEMRTEITGIDKGIYNLAADMYKEYMQNKPISYGLINKTDYEAFIERIRS